MPFASVIHEHLELRRRNATLEHEMPLVRYMPADPFDNHPLFKTEEQARVEDTMDGVPSIVEQPTSLDWLVDQETSRETPPLETATKSDWSLDEMVWARSRDFDWGD